MFTRKTTSILLALSLSGSFALAAQPEAEMAGSEGPKLVAEAIHLARVHGIDQRARDAVAGAPGSAQAQAVAESIHLGRQHGQVNDSADQRMLREASRL